MMMIMSNFTHSKICNFKLQRIELGKLLAYKLGNGKHVRLVGVYCFLVEFDGITSITNNLIHLFGI